MVVGDILNIIPGMEIPAECLVVSSAHLLVDEEVITGSIETISKASLGESLVKKNKITKEMGSKPNYSTISTPILLSGSKVLGGEGKMLVVLVGQNTFAQNVKKILKETPLQKEMKDLSFKIGMIALQSSMIILVVLLMRFIIERSEEVSWDHDRHWDQLFHCFLIAVIFFLKLKNINFCFLNRSLFLLLEFRRDCFYL